MQKIVSVMALTLLMLSSAIPVMAATDQSVNATATIVDALTLSVAVKELDAAGLPTGPDLGTSMNFGVLVKNGFDAQYGSKSFAVFLGANTSGRRYTIAGTMAFPSNGTDSLPNATLLKVIGATRNNADIVGDVFDANAQAAVMNNQIIYTSSNAGDSSLVNLVYGISGGNADGSIPFPGWQGIAFDFPGGEYSSAVSYSLVLL